MAIRKTLGLVLRRHPFRETSIISVFFSPQYGKFSGVLKGIRSNPSKFNSSADLFTLNEVVYYPSRNSSLHLVSRCDLIRTYISANRYEEYRLAGSLMRFTDIVTPEYQANERLFDMLLSCLDAVGRESGQALARVFSIKLLDIIGFRPHLDGCVSCLSREIDSAWFSHRHGGLLCAKCRGRDASSIRISTGIIKAVKTIERLPLEKAVKVRFSVRDAELVETLLHDFMHYHIGRKLSRKEFKEEAGVGNKQPGG